LSKKKAEKKTEEKEKQEKKVEIVVYLKRFSGL